MENKSYGNEALHAVLLDAMKDIDKICKENNLKYFLYAGTLLGAINHRGFIPWDDDVDIVMVKADHDRLLKIISEEYSDKYFVQTYKTDYYHPNNRTKIRINGTKFNTIGEYDKRLKNNGMFIDIAALYNVPNNKLLRIIQKNTINLLDIAIQVNLGIINPQSFKAKLLLNPISKISRIRLGNFMDWIMKNMGSSKSKDVGILCHTFKNYYVDIDGYENDIRPKTYYENPIFLKFEDTEFMTISKWDEDLKKRYGKEYMKPYPEKKRITKHGLKCFEIEDWVKERCGL